MLESEAAFHLGAFWHSKVQGNHSEGSRNPPPTIQSTARTSQETPEEIHSQKHAICFYDNARNIQTLYILAKSHTLESRLLIIWDVW